MTHDQPTSPLRAVRAKCLDCCCGQREEVKLCTVEGCALHAFRGGRNPYRKKRVLTDEQRLAMAERLRKAREAGLADDTADDDEEDDCGALTQHLKDNGYEEE